MPTNFAELNWKECIASAHHWETLVFENAKNHFTVVAAAFGAAGATLAWPNVPQFTRLLAIGIFLATAILASAFAIKAIRSTKGYLSGFYQRRRTIEKENPGLELKAGEGSGGTLEAYVWCFQAAIAVAVALMLVALASHCLSRPLLQNARLPGADLSAVTGLTQADLAGACGDASTKPPPGLLIAICKAP